MKFLVSVVLPSRVQQETHEYDKMVTVDAMSSMEALRKACSSIKEMFGIPQEQLLTAPTVWGAMPDGGLAECFGGQA